MENQDLKWWQVRWGLAGRGLVRFAIIASKVIAILGLIAGVGYGAVYLLSPWLGSRGLSRVDPRVNNVPQSLPDKRQAPLSRTSLDLYGFRIFLPDQKKEEVLKGEKTTFVRLGSGTMVVSDMSHDDNWLMFKTLQNDASARDLLGSDLLHSRYRLMEAAVSATPNQVKWWRFRSRQNQRLEFLVMEKVVAFNPASTVGSNQLYCLYKIEFGEFHGFQFGNPEVAPYNAQVDVFDAADRHYQFEILGSDGHGPILSQSELNAMVGSIQHIQRSVTLHIENIEAH